MGECFIFVEQVPRDARQDPRLLLDFKLNPVEEERDGERENSISTTNYSNWPDNKTSRCCAVLRTPALKRTPVTLQVRGGFFVQGTLFFTNIYQPQVVIARYCKTLKAVCFRVRNQKQNRHKDGTFSSSRVRWSCGHDFAKVGLFSP